MQELYSPKQISNARLKAQEWHIENNISFDKITTSLGCNIQTFKCWCTGESDYFDDKLPLIAKLLDITLEQLINN